MIMRNKTEIITKLQKAMELYDELGFEYLTVKRVDIEKFSPHVRFFNLPKEVSVICLPHISHI